MPVCPGSPGVDGVPLTSSVGLAFPPGDAVAGDLNGEQHLVWEGRWPDGPEARAALLDLLERQHFRSVRRFSLEVVRCVRHGSRVRCALPGGALALAFADDASTVEETRVERRWRIEPGLLARRRPAGAMTDGPEYGCLRVGVERLPDGRNHAWVSVSSFPSRFLTPLPRALGGIAPLWTLWTLVGRLYSAFHAQAAYSCLRALARSPELGRTQ